MLQTPLDLGDGLLMRRAAAQDVAQLLDLHAESYADDPHSTSLEADEYQLRDLLEKPHPTFNGREMTVVEEAATGRIVSSQHLSHHQWACGGVAFSTGEIEHVSTRLAFRKRGLIRRQTEVMHAWSQAAGEVATAVNGIPWYYTKFGYELPVAKYGGRSLVRAFVPASLSGELAPYTLRPATLADVAFIQDTYASGMLRNAVSYVRDESHWVYELQERDRRNRWARALFILEKGSEPCGFVSLNAREGSFDAFEVRQGVPWSLAVFSVARWLVESEPMDAERRDLWSFGWLGSSHPAFAAAPQLFGHPETLGTAFRRGAWYLRVPDLVAFGRAIVPALEQRLARSAEAGYSGRIRIGRYGLPGLELRIENGAITVHPWQQDDLHEGEARLAEQTLLHLLFCGRSLEELEQQFPYRVGVAPHIRPVLHALFPAGPTYVLPLY